MTAVACGLELGHPGGHLVGRGARLRRARRSARSLLVQGGLPLRLGRADHLGGVRVDDVEEAHGGRRTSPGSPPESSSVSGVSGTAVPVDRGGVAGDHLAGGPRARPRRRRRPPRPSATAASARGQRLPGGDHLALLLLQSGLHLGGALLQLVQGAGCRAPPVVPPGWSLGAAAAGPRHARPPARRAASDGDGRPRTPSPCGAPPGAREHRTTSAYRGRRVAHRGDGVLLTAIPPGLSARSARPGDPHRRGPARACAGGRRPGAASQDCHYPDLPSGPCPPSRLPLPDAARRQRYEQVTIDELGTPLADVTFVVVDLETTGGSPKDSAITEIGAVKVRGGVVLGEFQTLVDPGREIPPYISVLTGITSMMVAAAPRIGAVLPAFLEFARGAVLVAHNAPFDLGFLKAACAENGIAWPAAASVDTAVLARRLLTRDEVPNCKLATLAPVLPRHHLPHATARSTTPGPPSTSCTACSSGSGPLGITSLEELTGLTRQVDPERLRKRHLADAVPARPGRLPLPRAARRAALRRDVERPAQPGAQLLLLRRAAQPDHRDGRRCPSGSTRSPARTTSRPPSASCGSSPSTSRATTAAPGSPSARCGSG